MYNLYLGDCRTICESLSENSVHLILADPPYFLDGMDNEWSHKKLNGRQFDKSASTSCVGGLPSSMRFDPEQGKRLQDFSKDVGKQLIRILRPGGHLLFFSQPRLSHRMAVGLEDAGFEIRDLYGWLHKGGQGKAASQNHVVKRLPISEEEKVCIIKKINGRKTPQLRPEFEIIVEAMKPKNGTFVDNIRQWDTGLIRVDQPNYHQTSVFRHPKPVGARKAIEHMTIKPVGLMKQFIEVFSEPGHLVMDPFMGSGTTGVACLEVGRDFIGIEKERGSFNQAKQRIEEQYGR